MLLYSEQRYLLKEGRKERVRGKKTSFPSLYNLSRQLKLVGNLHKRSTGYKSSTEAQPYELEDFVKYRLRF